MVAKDPQVAFLRERMAGRFGGTSSGPIRPSCTTGVEQLGQLILVEPEQAEVVTDVAKSCQLVRQQIEIPIGDFAGFLVGDLVGADRFGFEVAGHVDQNLGEPEPLGRLPAGVTDARHTAGVDDQRLPEAELGEDLAGRIDVIVVDAGIAFVRLDPLDGLGFDGPGFDRHENAHSEEK